MGLVIKLVNGNMACLWSERSSDSDRSWMIFYLFLLVMGMITGFILLIANSVF